MITYTTKQGDMWDSIAHEQLGSSDYTGDLMKANMSKVKYFIFPYGVVLKIPEIDGDTSDSLPPWKTGEGEVE